mmetsp:Transcript_4955/g.8101  ORF Transcript_4955/g.8101 Transcript_4955/m.8101 type:complete len:170 (+) Transcript_4955:77-586(+)
MTASFRYLFICLCVLHTFFNSVLLYAAKLQPASGATATSTNLRRPLKSIMSTAFFISLSYTPMNEAIAIEAIDAAINAANAPSYSNNARNFARIAQGDYSQGFQDISESAAARKRRAVAACKNTAVLDILKVSQKECTQQSIQSDSGFIDTILTALSKTSSKATRSNSE